MHLIYLLATIFLLQSPTNCDDSKTEDRYCEMEIISYKFIKYDQTMRNERILWDRHKIGETSILSEKCTTGNGLPLSRRCLLVNGTAQWERHDSDITLIDCQQSMFCEREIFHHFSIQANGDLKDHENAWERTQIGTYSSLRDKCTHPKGLDLKRKCLYDFELKRPKWGRENHLNGESLNCLDNRSPDIIRKAVNVSASNITNPEFEEGVTISDGDDRKPLKPEFEITTTIRPLVNLYTTTEISLVPLSDKEGNLTLDQSVNKVLNAEFEANTTIDPSITFYTSTQMTLLPRRSEGGNITSDQHDIEALKPEFERTTIAKPSIPFLTTTEMSLVPSINEEINISDRYNIKPLNAEFERTTTMKPSSPPETTGMFLVPLNDSPLLYQFQKPIIEILPADVQMTSEIFKNISINYQNTEYSIDSLKLIHILMSVNPQVLRTSAEVNATNKILEIFENYMDNLTEHLVSDTQCNTSSTPLDLYNDPSVEVINLSQNGVFAFITRNIKVFYVNPKCSLITGIAIYNSNPQDQIQDRIHYDSLNDFYYRFIYMNESTDGLLSENNLELASFIPNDMWFTLQDVSDNSIKIVFKIYSHDALFIEPTLIRFRKPFSQILSISLPAFKGKLPGPVPFIIRKRSTIYNIKPSPNSGCAYWNYRTWTSKGVYTNSSQNSNSSDLILCSSSHITQFTYLMGGVFSRNGTEEEIFLMNLHQNVLDIISISGCCLSLLGLMGIWITAALFKSWRSLASNKVLLNMCVAITMQMVLFVFVNTENVTKGLLENRGYTECIIIGALLQYSILVLFTWMLIVAVLQYKRYVTIFPAINPSHYLLKSALICWGFPLIPTLLVTILDSNSYIPSNEQLASDTGICYPSGKGLRYGVILPVSLMVLANFLIFLYIFYSISKAFNIMPKKRSMLMKQLRLSILLYFLLGLSWIFGIFAFMKFGLAFSYLFCLTATLQGFIMFLYFVVIDKNTRKCWSKFWIFICCRKSDEKRADELEKMNAAYW